MQAKVFRNLSTLNLSVQSDRERFIKALENVRKQLGSSYSFHTGELLEKAPEKKLDSYNPARPDQLVGSVQRASLGDAMNALQKVHEGAKSWNKTSAEERVALVEDLASWMEKKRYELAAWMVFEVGKTWREADADVCEAVDFCRYYASEMERLSGPRITQDIQGERNELMYFPKGVAVVIAPWNFPFAILTGMTIAALVTGNATIIKPAEQSPVIGAMLAQGLKEVGFPLDSFYFLPGIGEEIGPALVADPRVDIIVFTGSAEVGLSIINTATEKPKQGQRGVKKVIAEMGGKNALIVDEDADIDEAIKGSIHSAFGFQGQKCSALSRLFVHEKIYDQFVDRFVNATKSLKIGNPENPDFQMGPVIDKEAYDRLKNVIHDADARCKTLYEASDLPQEGYYIPPSIYEVTDPRDPLMQKEFFGPVVGVMKIVDIEDGVKMTNSVPYALTGGIFTRSPRNIEYVKKHMEVGNLYINRAITGAVVERHPFGGFKMSGIGSKAGGPDYLLQFMEPRTFIENTVRRGFAAAEA